MEHDEFVEEEKFGSGGHCTKSGHQLAVGSKSAAQLCGRLGTAAAVVHRSTRNESLNKVLQTKFKLRVPEKKRVLEFSVFVDGVFKRPDPLLSVGVRVIMEECGCKKGIW